ncbi:MAG: V-type ATP synthase subunit F [Acutalibacteraceae bacterium]
MYKIAVMGDKDSVYGFASIGLEIFPVSDAKTATEKLRMTVEEKYAVVFITEALAHEIQSEIDKYSENVYPAIIPIPGVSGNTGDGLKNVSRFVEQAVGSDILA